MTTALRALALATLLSAVSAAITVDLPLLPPITLLPSGCGRVAQIPQGATCESLASAYGITVPNLVGLNPLTLIAGIGCTLPAISLVPGNRICVGDTLSFCQNLHVASSGETCSNLGGILAIGSGGSCGDLAAGTQVCLAPPSNQCARSTICGQAISSDLQQLFATVPDYCSLVSSCQGTLAAGTYNGKPALNLYIIGAPASLQSVAATPRHPELNLYLDNLAVEPTSQLQMSFVPKALDDGGNYIDFTVLGGSSRRRKLLAQRRISGGMGTPPSYRG